MSFYTLDLKLTLTFIMTMKGVQMSYSIKQIAEMMGVTTATLRYYDQEGLLPDVKRVNGIRVFEDKDFKWLRVLNCLKNTNMPIKVIKKYVELSKEGDKTLQERYELILKQEKRIQEKIKEYKHYLKEVEFKKQYYEEAMKAGSEKAVKDWPSTLPTLELDRVPNQKKGGKK